MEQQNQLEYQNVEQEVLEDFQDLNTVDTESLGKTFRLIKKLDSGSFGEIYHALNLENNVDVAVKLELANTKQPMLFYEAKIYQYLHREKELTGAEAQWAQRKSKYEKGIPKVFYCSNEGEYNILVMELLGPNLEDLFNICNKKFTQKTVCMIAIQTIQRIEFLHSKGFLHRDIKPQNFCIGLGEKKETIYLIDIGFAKQYITKNGKHIPYSSDKGGITGTLRFASINNHKNIEHSRRDDLESLAYMLIYFLKSNLPWMNLKYTNKKEKFERVYDKKIYIQSEALCKGLPEEFQKFLTTVQGLQFEEKPNYSGYIQMFQDFMVRNNWKDDQFYDWRQVAQKVE